MLTGMQKIANIHTFEDRLFLRDISDLPEYSQRAEGVFFILFSFTCSWFTDIFAYFTGRAFGKHKLNERVSPKKTWEGFFGGVIVSILSTIIFGVVTDACGVPMLPGVLDTEHWYNILILSILIPIFGVFGDLIFSQIKRNYNIKDFGKALKSHGGVLDRLDSILIVSIAMSLVIEMMANGWSIFE